MKTLISLLAAIFSLALNAQPIKVASGKIVRHAEFPSNYVDTRNIDVWLPDDYTNKKKYAVIYMQDGQMLFDASQTKNEQEWGVDEVIASLLNNQRIRDCIVVGIWNNGDKRHAEYFPQRSWKLIPEEQQQEIIRKEEIYIEPAVLHEGMLADKYLRFIVRELKPFIDQTYSTLSNKHNTIIMGSSMGGLISCYAMCEYPGIFGAAICMSTHWPAVDGITLNYLEQNTPNAKTHRIYFDYGTKDLDAQYEPYQLKADSIFMANGYLKDLNYQSLKFEGASHSEQDWRRRLNIPLEFILPPDKK